MPNIRTRRRSMGASPRRLGFGNPRPSEEIHDTYRTPRKAKSPARCAECGATYRKGRWSWERLVPPPRAALVCPACRRTRDRYPAGEVTVHGGFYAAHAGEALRLLRNTERAERDAHPLHRIMDVRRSGDTLTVTTTDIHLPRRIGHALESTWGGRLETHYDPEGHFVRVAWERE
jgi:hypothetical protein